uniref:Ubiquitin-like protease family profile domain-containing protein n=1 Tax=Cyprinus carpio TaxID=7962 RepID=A0A8C2IRZ3_CYPCA
DMKLQPSVLVVYPPPPAKGGITIAEEDLSCLEEGEFLNDELEKEDASKYHVFSSFFFKCLTQKDHRSIRERWHSRVKTWTRSVNLFDKDFIFVPMNQMPCILMMDSFACSGRSSVVHVFSVNPMYLQEEWKAKTCSEQSGGNGVMNGWSPLVPQQDNYTDCGIYLLQYVESFLKDPPQTFHCTMNGWFSQRTVKRKRRQIKQLILRLHRQENV